MMIICIIIIVIIIQLVTCHMSIAMKQRITDAGQRMLAFKRLTVQMCFEFTLICTDHSKVREASGNYVIRKYETSYKSHA